MSNIGKFIQKYKQPPEADLVVEVTTNNFFVID